MAKLIDLSELTRGGEVHNLSGHERGLAARAHFGLDAADAGHEPVQVIVPPEIYTLTPSFFQGMFAKSVHALGDGPKFMARFCFQASPIVLRQIARGVSSLKSRRDELMAE
jgi:hypothetical protein